MIDGNGAADLGWGIDVDHELSVCGAEGRRRSEGRFAAFRGDNRGCDAKLKIIKCYFEFT